MEADLPQEIVQILRYETDRDGVPLDEKNAAIKRQVEERDALLAERRKGRPYKGPPRSTHVEIRHMGRKVVDGKVIELGSLTP